MALTTGIVSAWSEIGSFGLIIVVSVVVVERSTSMGTTSCCNDSTFTCESNVCAILVIGEGEGEMEGGALDVNKLDNGGGGEMKEVTEEVGKE